MKPAVLPLLLLLFTSVRPCLADALPRYKMTVLPLDFSGYAVVGDNHDKGGINARGQVAGMSALRPNSPFTRLAARWQRGHLRILDLTSTQSKRNLSNDYYSAAGAVNIHGETIGEEINSFSGAYSDTYTDGYAGVDGRWFTLGKVPAGSDSEALGINDHGDIVGGFGMHYDSHLESVSSPPTPPSFFARHAFLWHQAQIRILWVGTAQGINNRGEIIGTGANGGLLWRGGKTTLLKMQPVAINERGEIAGNIPLNNNLGQVNDNLGKACIWRHGKLTRLSARTSHAYALNNRGQVVGQLGDDALPAPLHALLWQNGRTYDLNHCVPLPKGWVLDKAIGINDSGWIIGEGSIYKSPKDKQAAKAFTFLLTPLATQNTTNRHARYRRLTVLWGEGVNP